MRVFVCGLGAIFFSAYALAVRDEPKRISLGSFHSSPDSAFVGKPGLIDYNENFVNGLLLGAGNWTQDLQAIQNQIDQSLVLPQSLVRSFVLVAEKRLPASKEN